jgi:hypothetical protein
MTRAAPAMNPEGLKQEFTTVGSYGCFQGVCRAFLSHFPAPTLAADALTSWPNRRPAHVARCSAHLCPRFGDAAVAVLAVAEQVLNDVEQVLHDGLNLRVGACENAVSGPKLPSANSGALADHWCVYIVI